MDMEPCLPQVACPHYHNLQHPWGYQGQQDFFPLLGQLALEG